MNDQDTTNNALPAGDDQEQLESGDDLALSALSQANDDDADLASSDDLADTLNSLQRVIERSAEQLSNLKNELKEKRESLKSVFENDIPLAEAKAQVDVHTTQLKERKAKLQSDPQVTSLKVQIGELNEQKKEIEESLSNHLINYYSLTNSTSFDTSDGDQWDFTVRAKVKAKKAA
jgi:chromosome segregation ATPase